jgi:hypothetical protein
VFVEFSPLFNVIGGNRMNDVDVEDAARPLLSVLSRRLVISLTLFSFLAAAGSLLAGILWPQLFEHPFARFCLCVLISAFFGVFFFVLYPQTVEVTSLPGIDWPKAVKLVGPVALFLVLTYLLWHWMPVTQPGRFFRANYVQGQERVHNDVFHVNPIGEDFEHFVAVDKDGRVVGIYVKFASGRNQYKAEVKVDFREPVIWEPQRGIDEDSFTVPKGNH